LAEFVFGAIAVGDVVQGDDGAEFFSAGAKDGLAAGENDAGAEGEFLATDSLSGSAE
jgi:hypothetical protein